MPKKSAKSAASAAPSSGGAKPAPQSEDCRRGAGSRRKQRMPLRVTSDSEEPDVDTAGETPPTSKQELPSELTKAAASATVTSSATTSLIAALNTKRSRPPKAKDVARVQCGVCKEWVIERAFERHALSAHLGLARQMGDSQEFTKSQKLSAFGRVLKAGGKLQCPLCKKCLTSALGFFHHQGTCGKDVNPVKCPQCGYYLKPLSLPHHMRKHEQEEKNKGEEDCEPPKKRKRQSAAKLSKSNDPDYEPDEVVTARSSTRGPVKRGFSAPRLAPHPNTVAKWERALQTERQLTCQMPGCQFQADSADDMVTHYPNCPGLPAKWKLFTCDHCGEQADTETDIVKHVEQSHRSAAPETAGPRGKPNMRRTGAIVPDMAGELTYFTAVERQSCPREQTEKYWSQLPKSRVLSATARKIDGWRPAGQESRRYMPPMKLSPAYKVQEIGNPDPHRTFERLDPFAFEELDNGVLCFSGGPVVACDWCPLPADWSGDADETQFLAVACLPVVDAHLPPVEPSTLPTAVQVWSFSGDRRTARLEFALCVDGGPVWDLAWCPIGERTVPPADRLGCLALACGDGRVRVYTVPAPATLEAGSAGAPVFYRKEPDMRLEVFGDMGRSPCLRLAWAATEGNRSISAILGNGVVVFWNLQASSPLLCQTEGASQVLYPVQVIAAHRGHGTALAFSPASDRHLATGGRDRTLQMWDREEPASLQRAATKLRPMLTDLCWPIATKKLLNAYDHSLFVGSPSMMLSDVAMPVQDAPLFTHGAKCTSVSVNTTVNGLACGSESGLVALAQWRNMLSHKQKHELRRLLLKLEAERLEPTGAADGADAEVLLGDKYTQLWESCGVTIWEAKLNQKSGIIREGFDDHVSTTTSWVSNYPFVAVNKVSWNRNAGADSWLAVGMECGLLRVLSVPSGAFTAVRS
ncbi:uncharacterized protein LOC122394015 isoform X1 [Amphibalanus amphitrite]|uniref:uncharacterized protein LOC122394015 isoform X1 n=1 Tax=Amphibalanus amphitrite TaxID=1232801 RepID=UPI001C8FE5D1|nr:uncharacterized protein LOC122394015 isoform X1 [Amphibalanus amphitrite]XP_043246481.1 uncharacterized protein LOC122394015 isoform X1 [Amphibalanus amphitrite]XP_043246482.1 uncharacterized protein LOC122394015 isoform X1 [Amphibalanus amphitrite]XP_043246483.1 uncharacterized protein LOC122394015 isoform X1 [Amphibalanus amphitrite]